MSRLSTAHLITKRRLCTCRGTVRMLALPLLDGVETMLEDYERSWSKVAVRWRVVSGSAVPAT